MSSIYDIRRRRRRPPSIEELEYVLDRIEERLENYELMMLREMPLEEVVKILLLRGYPLEYYSREEFERIIERYEGWIFKRPVTTTERRVRELRIRRDDHG